MKRKLLFGLAVLITIITACNNSVPPENKKEGDTTFNPEVDAPVIIISDSALSDAECAEGEEAELSVSVKGDDDDFTYQWYSNTENSNEGGTPIPGADGPTFKPPTDEGGTVYYYVVITNKRNGKTTKSDPIKVTVNPDLYAIVIDISGNESGDTVTVSPDSGYEGDTVTLTYAVTGTAHYNLLDFSGVISPIDTVNGAGEGTRTYVINSADTSGKVITINAVFTHTNLVPDPIEFVDSTGHINKTYGDAAFTNAVAAGYNGSGAITYSSSDMTVATVNSSGEVTILKAGHTIITAEKAADAVYAYMQKNYNLTVNPKPVTITGLSAADKQYDGTTTATVTGTAVISGLVGGDTVTVGEGTAAFADKNAGTGKTVTFSGYSLTGTDAGNYTLSAQPTNATANITAKSVTITGLSAANKQYDGTTTATVTGTAAISGLVGGDKVTVSAGTAAFADVSIGNNKTVTFSDWALAGADAGNYSLSAQPANVTANISKAAGAAVSQPSVNGSPTGNSITVSAVSLQTATGQSIEYAISTASNGNGLSAWQSGVTFTGLNTGTTYYVYARSASNTNYEAGTASVSAGIKTAVTVTFNSNGGSSVSTQTITAGGVATRPANPTQSGYTFDYWYQDSALTIPYYFNTPVTANITLYAKWVTNSDITAMSAKNMVWIAGGTFTMGQNSLSMATEHPVTLSGFYMGKYEVMQKQYEDVMGALPASLDSTYGKGNTYPVYYVSWYDALVFCNKLSMAENLSPAYKISGSTDPAAWISANGGSVPTSRNQTWDAVEIVTGSNGYRLPTEAQWEYACRAGTTTVFNTGATVSNDTGWYTSNSNSQTHEVGLKPANPWGLYDMHGNVFEWCWEVYFNYSSEAQTNPMGPSGISSASRVSRGGSWFHSADYMRSANRNMFDVYGRFFYSGFRIIRP